MRREGATTVATTHRKRRRGAAISVPIEDPTPRPGGIDITRVRMQSIVTDSDSDGRRPLSGKTCLITNCGLLQGGPDAAEFQRQGATLVLQTTDFAASKPVLLRDGVKLEGAAPVSIIEADFSRS